MKHPVEAQISTFLASVLESERPDYVITVERKGTALLRSVRERNTALFDRSVNRVFASDALDLLSPSQFVDKRILLVDDTVYQGKRIANTRQTLETKKGVDPRSIKVAAFSVHRNVNRGVADYCWFGQLEDENFRETRSAIVHAFQSKGSLLLATERLQLVVELRCSRVELFDALCRAGVGVEQVSGVGRANLTIHAPCIVDEDELIRKLPFADTSDSIRKLRVIERSDGNFAICPIFYPDVNISGDVHDLVAAHPVISTFLGRYDPQASVTLVERAVFQVAAFVASAHLLRTAVTALEPLRLKDRVDLKAPSTTGQRSVLSQLSMLFPMMDREGVNDIFQSSLAYRSRWAKVFSRTSRHRRLDAGVGTVDAQKVREYQWRLLRAAFIATEHDPVRKSGLSWSEIVDQVVPQRTLIGDDTALLSGALDNAVDEADVVTDVGVRVRDVGQRRLVRVFRPDGEVISTDMRRVCASWKSDEPPPII